MYAGRDSCRQQVCLALYVRDFLLLFYGWNSFTTTSSTPLQAWCLAAVLRYLKAVAAIKLAISSGCPRLVTTIQAPCWLEVLCALSLGTTVPAQIARHGWAFLRPHRLTLLKWANLFIHQRKQYIGDSQLRIRKAATRTGQKEKEGRQVALQD